MTAFQKISLLAGAVAIAALAVGAASAQSADTRIVVIGAINAPAHVQPVTDGRDDAIPELPVVYDTQAEHAATPVQDAVASAVNQTSDVPASTRRSDLNQPLKSQ